VNAKQEKTLNDIFCNPVNSTILWSDVESLFKACGAHIEEGSGSRVCILLNDVAAVFHRPHPQKETDKRALKSGRRFLLKARKKNDEL
jgi:hypothetical protein